MGTAQTVGNQRLGINAIGFILGTSMGSEYREVYHDFFSTEAQTASLRLLFVRRLAASRYAET